MNDEQLPAKASYLLSLATRLPAQYSRIVVVTPRLNLVQESISPKFRASSIFPVILPASFGKCDFKFSYLAALKKRPPAGVTSPVPGLTAGQLADYEKYAYKCRGHLDISALFPAKSKNLILPNG